MSASTIASSFGLLDLFLGGSSSSGSSSSSADGNDSDSDSGNSDSANARCIRTPEALWDFLTVKELVNLRCISRSYRERLEGHFEYLYCRDGKDYLVPYPGFPGLLTHGDHSTAAASNDWGPPEVSDGIQFQTKNCNGNGNGNGNGNAVARTKTEHNNRAGLYPHQLASLRAMHQLEDPPIGGSGSGSRLFGALRGGVLGDAPGLGKTITTLALISSTAGRRPVDPPEFWDTSCIEEGWKALRCNPTAREDILRCLKPVRHVLSARELDRLSPPYDDDDDAAAGTKSKSKSKAKSNGARFPTLASFREHLHGLLRKNGPSGWPRAERADWELIRQNLKGLQIGMDKRNRKLLASKGGQRVMWERRLIPTSATLLVVPDALFEHWFQQIQEHLCLPMFAEQEERSEGWLREGSPVVRREETTRVRTRTANRIVPRGVVYLDGLGDLADVTVGEKVLENTSTLKEPVLNSAKLSGYLIVIVTFSRCRKEVRSGHTRAVGSTNADGGRRRATKRKRPSAVDAPTNTMQCSSLLKLRWLRLMVDEGHQLETDDNLSEFINQVAAERRWVVSGTPMTGNEDDPEYNNIALDQLQRILYFLRHPRYGVSKSEDVIQAWETEVKKPFLSRTSRKNLIGILKEIMIMHRKEDLKLPEPIFRQIEQEVSIPGEVEAGILERSSNSFGSCAIPYELDHYLHTPEFQSLVDDAQATYVVETLQKARETFQRVRSSSTFNGRATADFDPRPIKGVVYSSSNKDLLSVADRILRKISPENVAELYGDSTIGDMSSELERFRHGNRMFRNCPICKGENGMTFSRCNNDLMEVVSTETGERFLIEPERVLTPRNVPLARLGGEPMKNYSVNRKFWRVGDLLAVDVRESHPLLPRREPYEVWEQFGVEKCKLSAHRLNYSGRDWFFGPLPDNCGADGDRSLEMEVVLRKWQKCGDFHNAGWYNGPKLTETPPLRRKEDVFLLCLDADLAHGLDLSFVTHIFLLEAINDASLLEQVTSRAHRLGATGPVSIETINTFYKCSDGFQEQVASAMSWNHQLSGSDNNNENNQLTMINTNRKAALTKVVCHHCYRQFDSYADAEEHEQNLCPRNPENAFVADKYHLSSAYKEIRPPLPMASSSIRN